MMIDMIELMMLVSVFSSKSCSRRCRFHWKYITFIIMMPYLLPFHGSNLSVPTILVFPFHSKLGTPPEIHVPIQ